MATYNKFHETVAGLANGRQQLNVDTLKFALSNVLPLATNVNFADITEIAPGNGYTAGGNEVVITSSSQVDGVYRLVPTANVVFEAIGGPFATFQYVILYNDTAANKDLISWYDYGSPLVLNDGETFTIDVQATLFTLE